MKQQSVLVIGGAGYIGSHTCKALSQAGYLPIVLDSLVSGYKQFVKWGPLIQADMTDAQTLDALIAAYSPVAVLHFASFINVGESVQNPQKYYDNNVIKSLQLLALLKERGLDKVVFSSTAALYGNPAYTPIPETHPLAPINPYGMTKYAIEKALQDYSVAYGSRYVALRYFNAAGADPELEVGEAHVPETHLIPLVLHAVLGTRPPVTLFGQDYQTPDGTCIRDYIHVTDLAQAHVKALEYLLAGNPSIAMNLGTGQGYSVAEVVDAVKRVTQKEVPHVYGPRRAGDPAILVADPSLAKKTLQWQPTRSNLETIVADAWGWQHCLSETPIRGSF